MRSKVKWILGLTMLLCMVCTLAAAENTYQVLCRQNGLNSSDVIAWMEIPGASITMPVMRHPTDDAYYTEHDPSGKENTVGSLYVQPTYNAADFSDPVTLLYGSSHVESAPLRWLQETYSGNSGNCRKMYLHLPQETYEYLVFATLPHSSIHILHYYDFTVERRYKSFFDNVFSTRALGMHLDEDSRPVEGKDRVVILSTALRGDSLQRYLVMAKLVTQ